MTKVSKMPKIKAEICNQQTAGRGQDCLNAEVGMRNAENQNPFTFHFEYYSLRPATCPVRLHRTKSSALSPQRYALCAMPSPATRTVFPHLAKRRNPGDILPQHQGVHAGGAFQSTDGFQIAKVANNMMIGQDAPRSGDIPRHARNFDCLANIV